MHRALSLLAMAGCAAGCSRPDPAQPPKAPPTAPAKANTASGKHEAAGATHLTIYSGDYAQLAAANDFEGPAPGFALVNRALGYALKAGRNRISTTGLPRAMDAEAAVLKPLGTGIDILSQRHIAPPRGSQDVLAAAVGKKVAVEHTSGDAKQTDSGTLVSAPANGETVFTYTARYRWAPGIRP